MKDTVGFLLRETWKQQGKQECLHVELSKEGTFSGCFTDSYLCTTCGKRLSVLPVAEPKQTTRNVRKSWLRLRSQFRNVTSSILSEGTGTILDLTQNGCRMKSSVPMQPSLILELRIHVPDLDWPLMIDGAVIRRVTGQICDLEFIRLRTTEQTRVQRLVERLSAKQ